MTWGPPSLSAPEALCVAMGNTGLFTLGPHLGDKCRLPTCAIKRSSELGDNGTIPVFTDGHGRCSNNGVAISSGSSKRQHNSH